MLTSFALGSINFRSSFVSGPFAGGSAYLGIFTSIRGRGAATTIEDLTLPPGSLASLQPSGPFVAPYFLRDGSSVIDWTVIFWSPLSEEEYCSVAGWYVALLEDPVVLVAYSRLPSPVPLDYPTATFNLVWRPVWSPGGVLLDEVSWSG